MARWLELFSGTTPHVNSADTPSWFCSLASRVGVLYPASFNIRWIGYLDRMSGCISIIKERYKIISYFSSFSSFSFFVGFCIFKIICSFKRFYVNKSWISCLCRIFVIRASTLGHISGKSTDIRSVSTCRGALTGEPSCCTPLVTQTI